MADDPKTLARSSAAPDSSELAAVSNQPLEIARTVADATPALEFERPLESGDPRWQEFCPARGDDVMRRLRNLFQRRSKTLQHVVFVSHRGAGKSTELKRLAFDLRHTYRSIYLEANVEMDPQALEFEDLLLVLARVVEETMRLEGLPLPSELLERIGTWFAETIEQTQAGKSYTMDASTGLEIKAEIPLFAKLFARTTALFKVESQHRSEVKQVLRKYPGTLLESVNALLDAANKRLGEERQQELLLIIDNMDRYHPAVIDELLIRGGDRFRELRCKLILTPPISLLYRPETAAIDFLFHSVVMPSVRLRSPSSPYNSFDGPGRDLLLKALAKRIDIDLLIPNEAARDRLIFGSGGSIRELLEIALDATLEAHGNELRIEDLDRVLQRRRRRYRDRINASGWTETLLHIAATKQVDDDDKCLQILYNRLAFHYNDDGWYDVHPLITEIPEFRERFQATGAEDAVGVKDAEREGGAEGASQGDRDG